MIDGRCSTPVTRGNEETLLVAGTKKRERIVRETHSTGTDDELWAVEPRYVCYEPSELGNTNAVVFVVRPTLWKVSMERGT